MAAGDKLKEITEKVKQIVSEQLGVDEAEVTPSASFVDDLGADSLDQVELVMALEEAFDLEIPDGMRRRSARSRMLSTTSISTPKWPSKLRLFDRVLASPRPDGETRIPHGAWWQLRPYTKYETARRTHGSR